jgi:glycosyltransferase involved in cell wall biosynthesis
MKIALISTNSDLAGAPIYTSIVGRELSRLGHEVVFIFGSRGDTADVLARDNFKIYYLQKLSSRIAPLSDLKNLFLLVDILRDLSPSIVHLNSSKAALIGRIACFLLQLPCVYTVHGWGFGKGKPFLQSCVSFLLELLLSPLVNLFIFVSRKDLVCATRLLRLPAVKVACIYNGVPDIDPISLESGKLYDCLMLARVHRQKDHTTLLRAFALSPFSLALAGSETDNTLFQAECLRALGNSQESTNLIDFLGPRSDVPTLISRSSIVVLASVYEALPISLIEALRGGRPIVATDVGDVSSIVVHGVNGFLCGVGDHSALSSAIQSILSDPSLARSMGLESRRLYEERFSSVSMISEVLDIYSRVA